MAVQNSGGDSAKIYLQLGPTPKVFFWQRVLDWLNPVLLGIAALVVLLPLLAVLLISFAPPGATPSFIPNGWSWENYRLAWQQGNFWLAFANSTLVALAVTGFQVVTSALAGYALARLKFRGRQALLSIVLASLVIPFQLLVIPIFLVLKWGHAINTYWADRKSVV